MKRILPVCTMFIMALLHVTSPATAKVFAECGAYEGYGYFFEGPFVKGEKAGWSEDRISTGSVSIVEVDDKFDVIYTDVVSKNRSSRADGANVYVTGVNGEDGILSLLVVYPGTAIEIYTYHAKQKKLVLLASKYNTLINKTTMMVADCQ